MNKNIKVSVVVPVYNVEHYLEECLNSILNQTLKEIEIIAINDGSTDKSRLILEQYSQKFSNIKIIDQENSGPGAARNIGVKYCTGEYISFIDSDDLIDYRMYENMYNIGIKNTADIVVCDFCTFNDGYEVKMLDSNKCISQEKIYNNREAVELFIKDEISGYAWDKLYKLELFEKTKIKYEDNTYFEDMYPTLQLLNKSGIVCVINNRFYYYRQNRVGSITSSKDEKKFNDSTTQIEKCLNYIKNNNFNEELILYYKVSKTIYKLFFYYQLMNFNRNKIYNEYNYYLGNLSNNIKLINVISSKKIAKDLKIRYIMHKFKLYDIYIKSKSR